MTEMSLFVILLGGTVLLAALHMLAPDHWLPLMAVSSARKFSARKKYTISSLLGFLHAMTSMVVALAALTTGILLIGHYLTYLYDGGIVLLIVVGIYFILNGYFESSNREEKENVSIWTALGISVFPDLALLPIMITGVQLNVVQLGSILIMFTIVSGVTLPVVVLAASGGFSKVIERIPSRYVDFVMGAILILTAAILKYI